MTIVQLNSVLYFNHQINLVHTKNAPTQESCGNFLNIQFLVVKENKIIFCPNKSKEINKIHFLTNAHLHGSFSIFCWRIQSCTTRAQVSHGFQDGSLHVYLQLLQKNMIVLSICILHPPLKLTKKSESIPFYSVIANLLLNSMLAIYLPLRQNTMVGARLVSISQIWEPRWFLQVRESALVTITVTTWTDERRPESRFVEVFAQHNSTDCESTSHRCSHSWWGCYHANVTAKNKHVHSKNTSVLYLPLTSWNSQKSWPNMGCLSRGVTEEIAARKERVWTTAQSAGINKNSRRLERLSESWWQQRRTFQISYRQGI